MVAYPRDFYLDFFFPPLCLIYLGDFIYYPWWLYYLDAKDSQTYVQGYLPLAYWRTCQQLLQHLSWGPAAFSSSSLECTCSPGLRRHYWSQLPSRCKCLVPILPPLPKPVSQTSDSACLPAIPLCCSIYLLTTAFLPPLTAPALVVMADREFRRWPWHTLGLLLSCSLLCSLPSHVAQTTVNTSSLSMQELIGSVSVIQIFLCLKLKAQLAGIIDCCLKQNFKKQEVGGVEIMPEIKYF